MPPPFPEPADRYMSISASLVTPTPGIAYRSPGRTASAGVCAGAFCVFPLQASLSTMVRYSHRYQVTRLPKQTGPGVPTLDGPTECILVLGTSSISTSVPWSKHPGLTKDYIIGELHFILTEPLVSRVRTIKALRCWWWQ